MLIIPPIPSSISLSSLVQDVKGHATQISQANTARARLRSALKSTITQNGNTGGGGGEGLRNADWSACVNAASEYLPYLYAILNCIESDDLLLKSEPVFTWRTSLTTRALKKGNYKVTLPSFHYELVSTLFCYSICLSNQSSSLVASLGSYEISKTITNTALANHDETIQKAADMLCRASGILSHLSEVVIPRWETALGLESALGKIRPIELTRDVTMGLAKLCEADANLLAIRRLLSRSLSVAYSTTTPGPPLNSSHPSPSLLAKLHLHVHSLYDSARSLIKKNSNSTTSSTGEVSIGLRSYLTTGRTLALALGWKWLGVECGEVGGREKAGDSIGWLLLAKKELEELNAVAGGGSSTSPLGSNSISSNNSGGSGMKNNFSLKNVVKRGKEGAKIRKGKITEELESVGRFLNAYTKVNDSVHFMPIPSATTLRLRIPAGRAALTSKPFVSPIPAFKPRFLTDGSISQSMHLDRFSSMSLRESGKEEEIDDGDGDGDRSGDDDDEVEVEIEGGDYFGAGQYF